MQEFIVYRATCLDEPAECQSPSLPGMPSPYPRLSRKSYIGHTSWTLADRRAKHENDAHKHTPGDISYFHNALRAHNFNFFWEEIGVATSRKAAIQKERDAILKYDTLHPNGYNLRLPHPDAPIPENLPLP